MTVLDNQSQKVSNVKFIINGQYVSVKKIGVGGFGIVWQMYDFSLKNYTACKELLSQFSELKFVEMFYKEALIAKNIVHANIVRVQNFWKGNNGSFYILMDHVNGTDLENLIKRCNEYQIKIPWEFSIVICMSILRAIDYINRVAMDPITHSPYGIVYRDISPGNVLLSFEGNIKLSDFGIAKTADDLNTTLKESILTGKYSYMSPEQIKGAKDIDHSSDIFSTAVVLYEMLTGKQLFSGDVSNIKFCILNQGFNKTFLNGLDLPDEIGEILSKALQIDRNLRYERAIEMYRDLRRVLKGVDEEDIISDFSSFILKIMEKEFNESVAVSNIVKTINIDTLNSDTSVAKINTIDFIAGQTKEQIIMPTVKQVGSENDQTKPQPQFESKGKTIFEEVDDWFKKKIGNLKNILVKIAMVFFILVFVSLVCDIFLQVTPVGEYIYARINPADVIITTIPQDSVVSLKTKEGDVIIENEALRKPITLRNIHPGSYVVTAVKPGFNPIQRIITIDKNSKKDQAKIELIFDVDLNVTSYPSNAIIYVDGNKVGVSPYKVQLSAGQTHTLRLSLPGFDNLGSDAKEFKEGQCNIDFTKSSQEEIFAGVDKNFWNVSIQNQGNDQVFSIAGYLYKKINFNTNPTNMTLQVYGEPKPAGITPIDLRLKEGNYKIKILDPDGKYSEVVEEIQVSSVTQQQQLIDMRKLVTFRVKAKGSSKFFKAKLKIERKNINENNIAVQSDNIILQGNQKNEDAISQSSFSSHEINMSSNIVLNRESANQQENFNTQSSNKSPEVPIDLHTGAKEDEPLNNEKETITSNDNGYSEAMSSSTLSTRSQVNLEMADDSGLESSNIQDISADKPLSMSLPIGVYKFTFWGEGFESLVRDNVDIEKTNSINVELAPAKIPLNLEVSYINEDGNRLPVYGAAIWIDDIMLGKTSKEGIWKYKFAKKNIKGKIVAKGFMTQTFSVSLTINNNIKKLTLISKKNSLPIIENIDVIDNIEAVGVESAVDNRVSKTTTTKDGQEVVICSNCGYANIIPKGKKLKFCSNCGKPLTY
ncbi:MAG: protein kinase [Endomicrobium sp.]|jgi:serine/threonine-protein kinase|nr:protein kinase [Endomicrobium sp.]